MSRNNNTNSTQIKYLPSKQLRFVVAIIVLEQTITFLILFALYQLMHNHLPEFAYITVIAIAFTTLEALANLIIIKVTQYPIKIITSVLSQLCDEDTTLTPPNVNDLMGPTNAELRLIISKIYTAFDALNNKMPSTDHRQDTLKLAVLNTLPIGVIALDSQLRIIYANTKAPVIKEHDNRYIQLDFSTDSQDLEQWLTDALKNTINAQKTWTHIQNVPAGSTIDRHVYDIVASYQRNDTSNIAAIIITIDRTDEYVDSEGSMDFVTLAAHELRGPITVIRGYLDMLDEELRPTLSIEQKDLIDRLNVSARRLSSYVNNILNASRYDRRHLKLNLRETRVIDIQKDIENDMNLRASTLNRHISWAIPDNLPTVAADESSISEALSNLIDNAIKYSHDGGIINVRAELLGDFIGISVIDHGTGIPPAIAEHLFSKFYRSHRTSSAVGGSGLGLYISRAIVESHGGHISVQSVEGEGSTFTITLPIYGRVRSKLENGSNQLLVRSGNNDEKISNHGKVIE